ncbi:MAG: extracellular solute-binding protein, partial [Candidatus Cloacimonadota bacterium]|nr:extracellular solute-binding protein [Candidatus Cloacimonadota bacterium]
LNNLINKDKSAYLSTGYSGQNDFLAGKSAMIEGSSVSMAFMQLNGINFFIGFGPVPVRDTQRNIISGTNVAIFKNKDKMVEKAAWEFVKWFTEAKQTAKWSSLTYYMPVRKSAFEEPILKKRLESNPEIKAVYNQLNYATFEPQLKVWYKARKYLEEHVLEKVLRQDITPKEALQVAKQKVKELLQEEQN